jgi:endonuclease/exonuclease/phosphatase family metal-dependent hydrolase
MSITAATKSKQTMIAQAAPVPARASSRRAKLLRRALVAMVILAPVFYWAGERRVPAGGAEGAALSGEIAAPRPPRGSLRVGSFNIHAAKGLDGKRDITRIADCLRDLDLVALNEVAGSRPWEDWNQSQQLGEALGRQWLFAPTESRWWHGSFGNGLLSTLPVRYWQRIQFDLAGAHTHRNLVVTAVEVDGVKVNVLLTHLDSRDLGRRHNQLRAAGELFLSLAEPAILLGDLNSTADDEQLQRLLHAPGVVDAVAAGGAKASASRIDWILTRGLRTVESGVVDNGASDHPLVWAELEISPR